MAIKDYVIVIPRTEVSVKYGTPIAKSEYGNHYVVSGDILKDIPLGSRFYSRTYIGRAVIANTASLAEVLKG